jgi:hypothetical protein
MGDGHRQQVAVHEWRAQRGAELQNIEQGTAEEGSSGRLRCCASSFCSSLFDIPRFGKGLGFPQVSV